jgi:16S rRNA (guanine527-N7)-methyltransferase
VKHEDPSPVVDAGAALGVPLSVEEARRLLEFEGLLLERAVPAGLVAEADVPRLRERHVLDCLRAALAVGPTDRTAYDLGSGAGLPGIVVAVVRPTLAVTLVETRRRRAAFLELAVERLRLGNAAVAFGRVEELEDAADLCFARALAPLPQVWALARPLLHPGGRLVYFAGKSTGPFDAPGARSVDIRTTPVLERAGPLVIIAR